MAAKAYVRPRAYVRVKGPEAADLLQRIVSNDVLAGAGRARRCSSRRRARVIAPLVVWRRGEDDFLLLTEPELGETVRAHLTRMRIATRCEIELEEHTSAIVLGEADPGIPTRDYGVPAVEVLDAGVDAAPADDELERLRILARTPRWGREIDEGDPPGRGGARRARRSRSPRAAIPGQEPVARLHFRGHANRAPARARGRGGRARRRTRCGYGDGRSAA